MIYDCFSFFNELDILEIRLNTLKDVVDKFVLVEAVWTHTGKPKPLFFEENKDRFAAFLDRIIHIVVSDADLPRIPEGASERDIAWIRENVQRNAIAKGLSAAKPDDTILISDLDEIPRPEVVLSAAKAPRGIINLNLKNYAFFLNNLNVSIPNWTGGPQLLTYGTFCDPATYDGFNYSEYAPECANAAPSATIIRFAKKTRTIKNAGWHLTYMGGVNAIKAKLSAFAHTEFCHIAESDDKIIDRLKSGCDLLGVGDYYMAEPPAQSLPPIVQNNLDQYTMMILPSDSTTWRRSRCLRIYFRAKRRMHDLFLGMIVLATPKVLHPFLARIRRIISQS